MNMPDVCAQDNRIAVTFQYEYRNAEVGVTDNVDLSCWSRAHCCPEIALKHSMDVDLTDTLKCQ